MDQHGPGSGRFRGEELGTEVSLGEQAQAMATARELEWLASTEDVGPTADFADRVMAAVAREPSPRPVAAAASAARRGAILGVVAAFGDLWRVAWSGGRPLAVRAPAMALVILVLAGAVGAGALGVGAMAGLVTRQDRAPSPAPIVTPVPTAPPATPVPTLDTSPSPSASPEPSETPGPSETPEATSTDEPSGGSTTAAPTPRPTTQSTPHATEAPHATETPEPDHTPRPTDTPRPTESGSGGSGG